MKSLLADSPPSLLKFTAQQISLLALHIHSLLTLTFSQLLEIAAKASGFVIETETADFAHLDGDPFTSSRAFVYATGAPAQKGFLEEGNQHPNIPNSYKDAVKSPQ